MIRVTRPVTREMAERDHRTGRPFVLQLVEGGKVVRVKVKGSRTWFAVTVRQIYLEGARNFVAERKAAKRAEREARKRERRGQ
jgi:hypothetical protein